MAACCCFCCSSSAFFLRSAVLNLVGIARVFVLAFVRMDPARPCPCPCFGCPALADRIFPPCRIVGLASAFRRFDRFVFLAGFCRSADPGFAYLYSLPVSVFPVPFPPGLCCKVYRYRPVLILALCCRLPVPVAIGPIAPGRCLGYTECRLRFHFLEITGLFHNSNCYIIPTLSTSDC